MRGRQVFSDRGEVAKEALVGEEETGAKVVVEAEGVLQTAVRHQERLSLAKENTTEESGESHQVLAIMQAYRCMRDCKPGRALQGFTHPRST